MDNVTKLRAGIDKCGQLPFTGDEDIVDGRASFNADRQPPVR